MAAEEKVTKRRELQSQLLRLGAQYHLLESWCGSPEGPEIPFATGKGESFGYQQAEKLAHDFRNMYGLENGPDRHCCELLKKSAKSKSFTWRLSQVAVQPAL